MRTQAMAVFWELQILFILLNLPERFRLRLLTRHCKQLNVQDTLRKIYIELTMESNKTYYFLFKYVFLIIGLLIMIGPLISYLYPDSVEINGESGSADSFTVIVMGLLGILAIIVFFAIQGNFAIVELKNHTITIKQNGEERIVNWLDVTSISQIQFIQPPLYKLKTKDSEDTIWFNTEPSYISINGFTSDLSEMGELIAKKKRELGL